MDDRDPKDLPPARPGMHWEWIEGVSFPVGVFDAPPLPSNHSRHGYFRPDTTCTPTEDQLRIAAQLEAKYGKGPIKKRRRRKEK